jgi:hypothetical protein
MVFALRWVFCTDLRTESDLCFIYYWLSGFYNRGERCLQRGTDWFLYIKQIYFVFKRLKWNGNNFGREESHHKFFPSPESRGRRGVQPPTGREINGEESLEYSWHVSKLGNQPSPDVKKLLHSSATLLYRHWQILQNLCVANLRSPPPWQQRHIAACFIPRFGTLVHTVSGRRCDSFLWSHESANRTTATRPQERAGHIDSDRRTVSRVWLPYR